MTQQTSGKAGMSSPLKAAEPSSSTMSAPIEPNLRGLFAGDWASEEKITLLAETFTIFSSLQKIAADEAIRQQQAAIHSRSSISALLPAVQTLQYYKRIAGLYRDALKRYSLALEAADSATDTDFELSQWLHTILQFAETIYLPADGRGAGVVGEEILHWLNSFDFAPQTEEGQEIAQNAVPHEHPAYWSYILRCVLRGFHRSASSLLSSLSTNHPSPSLRKVSVRAAKLLSSMPRSTSFSLEHDFVFAHRKWVGQIRSLLSGLERDMDEMERELNEDDAEGSARGVEEIEDERLEFEAQFRCLLEVMAGVQERVFEACDDWREALGAWGTLIQPALKRDDVPETMTVILKSFPIDATLSYEAILAALAQGEATRACKLASKYDPWLAAHMTDLLDRVGVLEEESDEMDEDKKEATEPIRLSYLRQYAETLMDDQGLWRLAVDYLSYCGPEARIRMSNIVLDVPITGPNVQISRSEIKRAEDVQAEVEDAAMDEEAEDPELAAEQRRLKKETEKAAKKVSQEFNTAMDLIQTCVDLNMDLEARAICKKMALEMTSQRRFGPAIAYCVRANDIRQMKRIADMILLVYIQEGVEAYCQAVESIPPSLLGATLEADEHMMQVGEAGLPDTFTKVILGSTPSISSSRLAFLARYRDFHREYAAGNLVQSATLLVEMLTSGIAPTNFWAVLLIDAIPLLQDVQLDYFTKEQAFELLRVLDQVTTSSSIHPLQAFHYLGLLEQLLVGSVKAKSLGLDVQMDGEEGDWPTSALQFDAKSATTRLDILRLSLARRLARMST